MKLYAVLTVAALVLATGCAHNGSADTDKKAALVVSPDDAVKSLTIATGETFTFSAEENPSTGYAWSAAFDSAVIEAGASNFTPRDTAPDVVGAGGVRTMEFKGKAAGKTQLVLNYARSWESDSPARTVTYEVEVH